MPLSPTPEPERVYAYLAAHGWIPEKTVPDDGVVFVYREPSDFGKPITVLLPSSSEVDLYPRQIQGIIVTVAWIEQRSHDAVLADIWATPLPQPASAKPRTEPQPDPASPTTAETSTRKGA